MGRKKITKDMIEFILNEFSETRNSDEKLFAKILGIYKIYIRDLDVVTACNFLTRCRRKFHQNNMFLPTDPEVINRRKNLSEIYKRQYVHTKKDEPCKVAIFNDF
jgi:hypothetical protein